MAKLTTEELPSHTHSVTISSKSLTGNFYTKIPPQQDWGFNADGIFSSSNYGTHHVAGDGGLVGKGHIAINATHNHTATVATVGGNKAHSILQPYAVIYRWRRTA